MMANVHPFRPIYLSGTFAGGTNGFYNSKQCRWPLCVIRSIRTGHVWICSLWEVEYSTFVLNEWNATSIEFRMHPFRPISLAGTFPGKTNAFYNSKQCRWPLCVIRSIRTGSVWNCSLWEFEYPIFVLDECNATNIKFRMQWSAN